MSGYNRSLHLALSAADTNGIAHSQSPAGAGALTLNGDLVTSGVATLSPARRVAVGSVNDVSSRTLTITGTGTNGLAQTETITGPHGTGSTVYTYTTKDFLTVTSITISGSATAVIAGTNTIGSTAPFFVDPYVNPQSLGITTEISGSATYTMEFANIDLSPLWDLNSNTVTWYSVWGFDNQSNPTYGKLDQPCTLLRLTILSGTGTVTARIRQGFIAGSV